GEGGRSGQGIPADARSKPGSGGQLVAFVPSLDLVAVRQTGSSGDWPFEEYLRRACAAVLDAAEQERRADPHAASPGAGEGRKDPEPAVPDGKGARGRARNRERAMVAHRLGIRFAMDSFIPQR